MKNNKFIQKIDLLKVPLLFFVACVVLEYKDYTLMVFLDRAGTFNNVTSQVINHALKE